MSRTKTTSSRTTLQCQLDKDSRRNYFRTKYTFKQIWSLQHSGQSLIQMPVKLCITRVTCSLDFYFLIKFKASTQNRIIEAPLGQALWLPVTLWGINNFFPQSLDCLVSLYNNSIIIMLARILQALSIQLPLLQIKDDCKHLIIANT